MRAWEYDILFGAKLFVADGVFKLEMLRIVLSEFDEIQKQIRFRIIWETTPPGTKTTNREPTGKTGTNHVISGTNHVIPGTNTVIPGTRKIQKHNHT